MSSVKVEVASQKHIKYVSEILKTIEDATKVRGTGIAKRKPEYIEQKINEVKAAPTTTTGNANNEEDFF